MACFTLPTGVRSGTNFFLRPTAPHVISKPDAHQRSRSAGARVAAPPSGTTLPQDRISLQLQREPPFSKTVGFGTSIPGPFDLSEIAVSPSPGSLRTSEKAQQQVSWSGIAVPARVAIRDAQNQLLALSPKHLPRVFSTLLPSRLPDAQPSMAPEGVIADSDACPLGPDILCIGLSEESIAAAEAAALHGAQVCLVSDGKWPEEGSDAAASVLWPALRHCMRRTHSAISSSGALGKLTFDDLWEECDKQLERLQTLRAELEKQNVLLVTGSVHIQGQGLPSASTRASASRPRAGAHGERRPVDELSELRRAEYSKWLGVRLDAPSGAHLGQCLVGHCLFSPVEEGSESTVTFGMPVPASNLCQLRPAMAARSASGRLRICIIGNGWRAAELYAFCELANAKSTWLVEQCRSEEQVMEKLIAVAQLGGLNVVRADALASSAPLPDVPEGGAAARVSAEKGPHGELEFMVALGSSSWGPFDFVLSAKDPKAPALPRSVPRPVHDSRGRPEARLWLLGIPACSSKGPAEFLPSCLGGHGLESTTVARARALATRLANPEVLRASAALNSSCMRAAFCWPLVGMVGMSEAAVRATYPEPRWRVEVSFSSYKLPADIPGRFSIGFIGVAEAAVRSKDIAETEVMGAAIFVEAGGAGLLCGLMIGLEAALKVVSSPAQILNVLRPLIPGIATES